MYKAINCKNCNGGVQIRILRSAFEFEFWVWVSVAWPLALIDMCLCVYGQQGVLNLQPHIKKLQAKMAALVQLRPQHNSNNNNNSGKIWQQKGRKSKDFEMRIIINVVVSTAINNRQQRTANNFLHPTIELSPLIPNIRRPRSKRDGATLPERDGETARGRDGWLAKKKRMH